MKDRAIEAATQLLNEIDRLEKDDSDLAGIVLLLSQPHVVRTLTSAGPGVRAAFAWLIALATDQLKRGRE